MLAAVKKLGTRCCCFPVTLVAWRAFHQFCLYSAHVANPVMSFQRGAVAASAGVHKKKAALWSLEAFLGQAVIVTCHEDREITGVLRGFDSNMNVVVGDAVERFAVDGQPVARKLGAAVVRGASIAAVCLASGRKQIDNPF